MTKRDEFIAKMKSRLDEWNLDVDKLEDKIRKVKAELKEIYQTQIDELRKKRREGDRKLEQIRTAGEGKWEHLKTEAENAWVVMKDALETFKTRYRKNGGSSDSSAEHRK